MSLDLDVLHIMLLTPMPELGTWLCEQIGCDHEGDVRVATVSDRRVAFSVASKVQQVKDLPARCVPVVLLRYVDVASLQSIMELLESRTNLVPALVLLYRNDNEADFKMSCPYCGQKLWVRDADQDKRGRCPHCLKGFTLPAQEELVASTLSLSASVPIRRIVRGDLDALTSHLRLVLHAHSTATTLKALDLDEVNRNETMRVDVEILPEE